MAEESITFVTSWGPGGYDLYAKRFLESFKANFPQNSKLLAYFHDCELPADAPQDPRITYQFHTPDGNLAAFKHKWASKNGVGLDGKYDFRFDAVKFSNKVYSIEEARKHVHGWLVWIDADTVATAPIPEDFFQKLLCGGETSCATLMRADCAYAETSFMAFDLRRPSATGVLDRVLFEYQTGDLFKMREHHDGWVYSEMFKRLPVSKVKDLAPASKGLDAFHQSPLVAFMQHFKGNKKREPQPFRVTPVHVVPHEEVAANMRSNMATIKKRMQAYLAHGRRIHLVGAGPTVHEMRDALQFAYAQGDTIACVKHSLPILRSWGIEPHYCIVLDPRSVEGVSTHGAKRKDLYGGQAGSTEYLVASMTNPDTVEHLRSLGAKLTLWHAFTQQVYDAKIVPADEFMVIGGTCAVLRGLGIFYSMGFRRFDIYGVDAGQAEKPSDEEMGQQIRGNSKWFQVGTHPDAGVGIKWWTTGELVALAQDVDGLAKKSDFDASVKWHGKSLAQEMWDAVLREELPEYGS